MATVDVVFASLRNGVPRLKAQATETITSSGTSQATTAEAESDEMMAVITVSGSGDVWVTAGASPTAAAQTDYRIVNGETRAFALDLGDKVAVIDA